MNRVEFGKWWDYHTTRLPTHDDWVSQHGEGIDGCDTLLAWCEALSAVTLRDAMQCTDAILSGVHQCYGAEGLVKAVQGWTRHVRDSTYDRNPSYEERYDCPHCLDSGVRLVFSVAAMRAAEAGRTGVALRQVFNVACTCSRGDRWCEPADPPRGAKKPKPVMRFNANCMVPIAGTSPTSEEVAAMCAHVEAAVAARVGRYAELDEFNQGL